MKLSIIVAMSSNRVIGRDGAIPWHLSDDLRRFKRLTMGWPIIMGRRTWESLGRPLPGRTSIVLSRKPNYQASGAVVVGTLDRALTAAGNVAQAFIIGGESLYASALPLSQRIYLTLVEATVSGDTFFPPFDSAAWVLVSDEPHAADDRNNFPFRFQIYDRRDG